MAEFGSFSVLLVNITELMKIYEHTSIAICVYVSLYKNMQIKSTVRVNQRIYSRHIANQIYMDNI